MRFPLSAVDVHCPLLCALHRRSNLRVAALEHAGAMGMHAPPRRAFNMMVPLARFKLNAGGAGMHAVARVARIS